MFANIIAILIRAQNVTITHSRVCHLLPCRRPRDQRGDVLPHARQDLARPGPGRDDGDERRVEPARPARGAPQDATATRPSRPVTTAAHARADGLVWCFCRDGGEICGFTAVSKCRVTTHDNSAEFVINVGAC